MKTRRLDTNYLKTLTVLYVEDDDDTREQFSEFLQRSVGLLIMADNGAKGLEAFKSHQPDIVITDILMPVMDGLTMAEAIRGLTPSVPIIVVTAFEQNEYLRRAIDIGIDKYVTKPVNSSLLLDSMLVCARRLRGEELLKLAHQHKIEALWTKHHENVAILAGGMAHDYNNLLQAILGSVALAKLHLDPQSESRQYLNEVDKCADEACTLANILTLLGETNREFIQLGPILPLFQYTIEEALKDNTILLTIDCPKDLPPVEYVHYQMHRVVTSLTTNALEAMPTGGQLTLSARTAFVSEHDPLTLIPGNYLHIFFSDNGTGIPAENLPKIFDAYFSTKKRGSQRGMGLSLALCHSIIMKHGGIITAESSPGNGSTFHIWLPIAESR